MKKKPQVHTCDAEVTIKFLVEDICKSDEVDDMNSLWQAVYELLEENGIYTYLTEDEYEIVEVKEI